VRGYATELSVRGLANTFDGVPLNSYTFATSFYDKPVINLELLERIEVIRGPGSTLYGSDAFHGVLAYGARRPTSDSSEFRITGGAPGYVSSSLHRSQSLGDGRLHTTLATQKQGRQDLAYRYTSPDSGDVQTGKRDYAFRDLSASITYELGDIEQGLWRFNGVSSHYDATAFPGIGTQFFPRVFAAFDLDSASIPQDKDLSDQSSSFWLTQVDFQKQLSPQIELSSQIYHWQSKQEWRFDNSRYPASLTTRSGFGPFPCLTQPSELNPNPLYCAHSLQQAAQEQRSGIEAHLKSQWRPWRTKWVAGAGIDRFKIEDSTFKRVASTGDVFVDEQNPYVGDRRYVRFAFAQGSTELFDASVQLVYGARYDDYSDIGDHTSPRLGLITHLSEAFTSKLLYGHAFRAPNAIERNGNFDAIVPNQDIKPEEIDTYEWVNIYHRDHQQVQLTLFKSKWQDGIVLSPTDNADNQYINTGKNDAFGAEISSRNQVGQWRIQTSASYVKSENDRLDAEYGAFPRWLLNAYAQYQVPGTKLKLYGAERVMLSYRQGDNLGEQLAPKARQYYRTDLGLDYSLSSRSGIGAVFRANIRNIFDRDNVLPSSYNAEHGLPDLERQFTVGVELQY